MPGKSLPVDEKIVGSKRIQFRFAALAEKHRLAFTGIAVRTGTAKKSQVALLTRFMNAAIEREDITTLTAIHDGGYRVLHELYDRKQQGLPAPVTMDATRLGPALTAWLASGLRNSRTGEYMAPSTLKRFQGAFTTMLRHFDTVRPIYKAAELPDDAKAGDISDARVKDVVDIVRAYREHCEKHALWRNYGIARGGLLLWSKVKGEKKTLYRDIESVMAMNRKRKRERDASIMPKTIVAIMRKMRDNGDGHFQQHLWNSIAMATRPSEYRSGALEFLPTLKAVRVSKSKTAAGKRFFPIVLGVKPASSQLVEKTFRKMGKVERGTMSTYSVVTFDEAFRKACNGKYQPYDLRASGKSWWRKAGVDRDLRQKFFGHAHDVSAKYDSYGDVLDWEEWKTEVNTARRKINRWLRKELGIKKKVKAA